VYNFLFLPFNAFCASLWLKINSYCLLFSASSRVSFYFLSFAILYRACCISPAAGLRSEILPNYVRVSFYLCHLSVIRWCFRTQPSSHSRKWRQNLWRHDSIAMLSQCTTMNFGTTLQYCQY